MKIKKNARLYIFIISSIICITGAISVVIAWTLNHFGNASAASTSNLNGKSVLFDGDSIAMGSVANGEGQPRWSYANYIEETYGISKTNVSYGGARFYWPNASTDCPEGYYPSNSNDCHIIGKHLTNTVKNTTYDYIILEGAINDLYSSVYSGYWSYFEAEFRSYLDTVTTNSKWANSKIGFVIVPLQNYNVKYGDDLSWYHPDWNKSFWEAIQSICDEYSIEYINFYKYSTDDGFTVPNDYNWGFMFNLAQTPEDVGSFDGLHPSKGGQRYIGEFIANWMVNLPNYKYTVTYNTNGSSMSLSYNSQSIVHSKKATAPTYTINDSQHFYYWSTNKSCTSSFNFNTAISTNTTLYACWSPQYKLTFNANNGTGAPSSLSCAVGFNTSCSVIISSDVIPTRTGFNFIGWWDNSSETLYQPGDSVILTGNKTLYASWTATLTYNANSGSGAPSSETCYPWTGTSCTVTISSTRPTRDGYTFLGWADSASANTAKYQPNSSITITGDKTIYAVWQLIPVDPTIDNRTNGNAEAGISSGSLTVSSSKACVVIGVKNGAYTTLVAVSSNTQNNITTKTYSASNYGSVIVALKGDGDFDGTVSTADSNYINRSLISQSLSPYRALSTLERLVLDIDEDGTISTADSNLINRSLISQTLRPYKKIEW